jgi:hypothetical protein
MEDFVIIGWPDIQDLMELEDFGDNATLIDPHYNLGIDSCTYLVSKEWLESLGEEEDEGEEEK